MEIGVTIGILISLSLSYLATCPLRLCTGSLPSPSSAARAARAILLQQAYDLLMASSHSPVHDALAIHIPAAIIAREEQQGSQDAETAVLGGTVQRAVPLIVNSMQRTAAVDQQRDDPLKISHCLWCRRRSAITGGNVECR